jgi:hypothetical protein
VICGLDLSPLEQRIVVGLGLVGMFCSGFATACILLLVTRP